MLSIRFHFTSLQANSLFTLLSVVFTQMANQKDKNLPAFSFISFNQEVQIRNSLITEIERCMQLDYCIKFNRKLNNTFAKLKFCLQNERIGTVFAFEFLLMLAKKELSMYARYGMSPNAFRLIGQSIMRGKLKPSVAFDLMYKNISKLANSCLVRSKRFT